MERESKSDEAGSHEPEGEGTVAGWGGYAVASSEKNWKVS